MNRFFCLTSLPCFLLGVLPLAAATTPAGDSLAKPNIIFVVADDMGYKDTGYSGNPIVKTPQLDRMAAEGIRFDNFYSAGGTCSPGRMAILTGRTPMRARMVTTVGPMQEGEVTVAAALKTAGYETGHFGKWGLGRDGTHPLKVGFDEAVWSKNYYDLGAAFYVGDSDKRDEAPVKTTGDTSLAIMEIALDFIGKRAQSKKPFFAQICFGSPHAPHQAAEEFKRLYPDLPESERNFWGEVSGLDAAVGKLREELRRLNIADNTLLWFVSDNGGISEVSGIEKKGRIGARTIGLLEWPRRIPKPMRSDIRVCHIDMYPTVLDIVGVTMKHQPVIDGISLLPLFEGKMALRPKPLGFLSGGYASKEDPTLCEFKNAAWIDMYPTVLDIVGVTMKHQPVIDGISLLPLFEGKMESRPKPLGFLSGGYASKEDPTLCEFKNAAWIDGRFMLRIDPPTKQRKTQSVVLYDILADPILEKNIADAHPEEVQRMLKDLAPWHESVKASFAGKDYLR